MSVLKELSKVESNLTAEYLATQIPGHPSAEQCLDGECLICSVRDCPHKEPLHYDLEGCPACDAPPSGSFHGEQSDPPFGYPGA